MMQMKMMQEAAAQQQQMLTSSFQFQVETLPNLTGLVFHEDQSGYLAGALAAHLSETGTIAAVQDSIRNQTAGVAVLGTLLDTMFSMREAIRFMHNLLLPLAAGRSGSIASKSAPDLVNF